MKAEIKKALQELREYIGKRNEHHANCAARTGKKCDCYARYREKQHVNLDMLEQYAVLHRWANRSKKVGKRAKKG